MGAAMNGMTVRTKDVYHQRDFSTQSNTMYARLESKTFALAFAKLKA